MGKYQALVRWEGDVSISLEGSGFLYLSRNAPRSTLSPATRQQHPQEGFGLLDRALQGEVEVLLQAVNPLVVDRDGSLPLCLHLLFPR